VAEELYATLKTNRGDIVVQLFPNHAPKTVANFTELAEGKREWVDPGTGEKSTAKLYDGTIFHRVIGGFMIQGGDPWAPAPAARVPVRRRVPPRAAVRQAVPARHGQRRPGTNGSQFFITVGPDAAPQPRPHDLRRGRRRPSREVVDAISSTATGPMDRPVEDVVIESVVVERKQS
jgi:peptidyl-prolyl cis-trans isomerase A (cyclophilin A)